MTTSYHRRQQEIRRAQLRRDPTRLEPEVNPERARPFPLVRSVDTSKTLGLFSLMQDAMDQLGDHFTGHSTLLRGALDHGHSVGILSRKDVYEKRRQLLFPSDRQEFLDQLANRTNTSDQPIDVRVTGVGIFGSRRSDESVSSINFGLTFDQEDNEQFSIERSHAIELLGGEEIDFRRSRPHISIGRIVLNQSSVYALKSAISTEIAGLELISLKPVQPHY